MSERSFERRDILKLGSAAMATGAAGSASGVLAQGATLGGLPTNRIRVAFVVDDGANMIDLAGAWEVFQDTRKDPARQQEKAFYLYAVGPERKLYHTTGNGPGSGLPFMPNYSLAEAPAPDVIVIGAQGNSDSAPKTPWLRNQSEQAQLVMSVCTGAFLLARTGLLDGRKATTHHLYFDSFAEQFPKVQLLRGRRFVDNGKFVSAGGLTSGIDSALHVVARLVGAEQAQATANYMEYESDGWRRGAALA